MGRRSRLKLDRLRARERFALTRAQASLVCIYCRGKTTPEEDLEHVFPASLGCDAVLPQGTVCKGCNNGFGPFDEQFLKLTEIAHFVGAFGIVDRKGKPRKHLGENLTFPSPGAVQMKLGTLKFDVKPGETGEATLKYDLTAREGLDELRLNRAICKAALNSIASVAGAATALRPGYDRLREHVRAPPKRTIWPYLVRRAKDPAADSTWYMGEAGRLSMVVLRVWPIQVAINVREPNAPVPEASDPRELRDGRWPHGKWLTVDDTRFWRRNFLMTILSPGPMPTRIKLEFGEKAVQK